MARNGAFSTTAYSNRCVDFNWSIAEQSISENYTIINWNIVGGGSATGYYKSAPFTVVIDGEQVFYSDTRIQLRQGTVVTSGQKRINHDADGTRNFSASVSAAIYTYAVNCSGSGSWSIDSIPRAATITGAIDVTDEGNPYFTFSNPGGFNLVAELEVNPNNVHLFSREISNSGSHTFELTEEERQELRGYLTNANSGTLRYLLYSNNRSFVSYVDKKITIVNANPILEVLAEDANERTVALTGDSNKIIEGHSHVKITASYSALKSASISEFKVTNGNTTLEAAPATFENASSERVVFSVTDSRGNKTKKTVSLEATGYIPLTCDLNAKAPNAEGEMAFTINGNCFQGSFGTANNSIHVYYRYKTNYDEYGDWIEVTDVTLSDDNTYMTQVNLSELDYQKRYTFQAMATDELSEKISFERIVKTIPVFDWSESDFNFNVPVSIQGLNVKESIDWKPCTLTAITNMIYGDYKAYYRYSPTCLEIKIATGTYYLNSEAIEQGDYMLQVSGLDVEIPMSASAIFWNDTNDTLIPVDLDTNGYITIQGSGSLTIPINHWLGMGHAHFMSFY